MWKLEEENRKKWDKPYFQPLVTIAYPLPSDPVTIRASKITLLRTFESCRHQLFPLPCYAFFLTGIRNIKSGYTQELTWHIPLPCSCQLKPYLTHPLIRTELGSTSQEVLFPIACFREWFSNWVSFCYYKIKKRNSLKIVLYMEHRKQNWIFVISMI